MTSAAVVDIVHAVEVHVLRVPGKDATPRAKVEVWRGDAGNGDVVLFQRAAQDA
eukprot:CAMPEP_0177788620 /NCGR_PEP_ID=MMETSP0491_2-20121128/22240_1 /TAXON_ID=63592 /ORGANISM="Tetraselmis chuii, Strain PLY429" /LENGTH=53 /DNA_ID=CAMNT_0019310283 /DNA_START=8 /DNA_END=167 /DNA_ORIENTATION=-